VFHRALWLRPVSTTAPVAKDADPKDVASIDSIMKAVYEVISGDAGKMP
jgi:hypothetical protein